MIAEQTSPLQTLKRTDITRTWRAPISVHAIRAIGNMALAVTRTVINSIKIGVLPHAALWEASLMANMLSERETHEPDPYSTQMPFISDAWPLS